MILAENIFNFNNDIYAWIICREYRRDWLFQESQFDVVIEDLFNATIKLEEKEKVNIYSSRQAVKQAGSQAVRQAVKWFDLQAVNQSSRQTVKQLGRQVVNH